MVDELSERDEKEVARVVATHERLVKANMGKAEAELRLEIKQLEFDLDMHQRDLAGKIFRQASKFRTRKLEMVAGIKLHIKAKERALALLEAAEKENKHHDWMMLMQSQMPPDRSVFKFPRL